MDKTSAQAEMFANRLAKRVSFYKKWSKNQRLTCYRIYDRDIPEIPLTIDYYGFINDNDDIVDEYACVALFERPYEKDPTEEETWLKAMCAEIQKILNIDKTHVILKTRKRQKGESQYEKSRSGKRISGVVREGDLYFGVNLSDYLDTGLFMDHRPLRKKLVSISANKRVLNLFGYTGALSIAAAKGGASFVQTVDLSNTYLNWAGMNLELNGFDDRKAYPLTRLDVVEFLDLEARKVKSGTKSGFDIILLDPPTFSNSKKTQDVLDTNKQWPQFVSSCLQLLNPGGILYFSTNSRKLTFDSELISTAGIKYSVQDVTTKSIPEDFKNHRIHRCWKFTLDG